MDILLFSDFWSPVKVSASVIIIASAIAFVSALLVAWFMKVHSFPGKNLLNTIFLLPLVLPPSVVGFGLLVLLGRNSWAGQIIEWVFGQPLVFTEGAAVIAAAVVAFPLMYMTFKTGFSAIDYQYEEAVRSMGSTEKQIFWHVTLPLAKGPLITGFVLGFARGIGEFGVTLMFAGNIPEKTQTMPTAIYTAVESGDMAPASIWVLVMVLFSLLLLTIAYWKK